MAQITIVDEAVRHDIRTNLSANLCVEAGAGTGKTTVLVARIIEILRTGYASIDQLAVITFTEKAAAELIGRVRERLETVAAESTDDDERDRLEQALRGLPRAHIETIHAFAANLLRERPVEAGLDPGFAILQGLAAELDFDEAFRDWRAGQLQGKPPALWRALNRGFDLKYLHEVARIVHENRDLLPLTPMAGSSPDAGSFVTSLYATATELEALLSECRDDEDRGAAQIRVISALADQCRALGDDQDRIERLLLQATKISAKGAAKNWTSAAVNKRQKELCTELGAELAEIQAALRTDALTGLLPAIEQFVQEYADQRRARGLVGFNDLMIWTRDLLRDQLEVRRYFQERFRCLLIDEFQDTDPLQVEITLYLCSDGQTSADWRELRPVDGKLFVVGDPKQSIYRFRRADITIYEWAKRELFGNGQRAIRQNFRSLDGVISWVNQMFEQLMQPEEGMQPAYVPLESSTANISGERAPVVLVYGDGSASTAGDIRQQEADYLATVIRRAVEDEGWLVRDPRDRQVRPARWGDVAILLPRRTEIERYENALAAAGIPYRHEGGRAFFQRQEVRELAACLRAIDDPTDGISLVSALRSSAFGCSDRDLLSFIAANGQLDYRQPQPNGHAAVATGLTVLRGLHDLQRELPLPALVQRVIEQTRLVEFALTVPQGDQRTANLLKIVDQARAFDAARGGGLRAFVRWLVSSSESTPEESDAAVAEASDDIVRLLTIHASKGLEFPIVALANLNGAGGKRAKVIADRDHNQIHLQFGNQTDGFMTPGFEEAAARELTFEEAQDLRLLYVAATRARDHLVLPFVPAADTTKGMLASLRDVLVDDAACVTVYDNALLQQPEPHRRATTEPVSAQAVQQANQERDAWERNWSEVRQRAATGSPVIRPGRPLRQHPSSDVADQSANGWRARLEPDAALDDVLHRTLAQIELPAGAGLEMIARVRAFEAGIPERVDEVIGLVRSCLASPATVRALATDQCYREVEFAATTGDSGRIEGQIDLLCREPDGLLLIDFRTDVLKAEDTGHLERDAAQLALGISRTTGLPVCEVIFVFANAPEPREHSVRIEAGSQRAGRVHAGVVGAERV